MSEQPKIPIRYIMLSQMAEQSDTFTTSTAREWYKLYRGTGHYSNLFTTILLPLSREGLILRVARGVWRIQNRKEAIEVAQGAPTPTRKSVMATPREEAEATRQAILKDLDETDEFEAYIATKLKQGV